MTARATGVILAGGRSSRMAGERKALVLLDGEPLLSRVIRQLRPQVERLLLSCEPEDKSGDESDNESGDGSGDKPGAEALSGFGCTLVADAVARHRGPLAGLYSTLLYLHERQLDGGLVLCPCDAPFIPATLVEQLQKAAHDTPGAVAVVSYEGVLQPTFSLWQSQHLSAVKTAVLDRQQGGLKHMLHALPHTVIEWPVAQPPPFYNINTPEQLASANEWLSRAVVPLSLKGSQHASES